ncbi:hypothetical protein PENCOP_c012G07379 [Penicillium coprophilum]|uniref:Xylanolytic transcriptional activator regulatory domain-containing protein n=1 Tax=Penicillium coprophilum TaxID=36646 RepID=A0A1V6UCK2_9EURO|nr:hypothetical protein PENCOP_c012G07379 [Penicillium coprophilum]
MNPPSHDEVDRVLRLKRKERDPCGTCQKRNHPHICTYVPIRDPRREPQQATASTSPSPARRSTRRTEADVSPSASTLRPDDAAKNYVYSGDNSVVSILRSRASDGNESMTRDLGSVLGLQNTLNTYPFMDPKTPQERWGSLLNVLPQRNEVLKFFHYYRVTAYPFNPIIADMNRFELDLCTYLNAYSAGELREHDKISDRWVTDKSISHISLLLAALAAGAHYSDIEYPQRLELATDFVRRSFHALRLANFLFRPSLDTIQALLIIGNTLQNMGQSDAAWALLGTTVRLAQTMGLHTERSNVNWPESTIVWQDSLLSMSYDRPPIVTVTGWSVDSSTLQKDNLSYLQVMHSLCRLGIDIMRPESSSTNEFDRGIEALQRLDTLYQGGQPHLQTRSNCTTLQEHLEHLALRMHSSFCVSVVCRPAMKQSQPQPQLLQTDILRNRAKGSLIEASRAFLDFQALSVVPLRSWSMVHTVLSSTLLLCMWEETRNDPECRDLQQRVIDVFTSSNSRTIEEGAENDIQWLSARHIRALVTLRGALDRQQDVSVPENETWAGPGLNPGLFGSSIPDAFFDIANPIDNSPVSYLDSIMNDPMFDFTQENGFL